jgi:PAS domain S-box-containing protein
LFNLSLGKFGRLSQACHILLLIFALAWAASCREQQTKPEELSASAPLDIEAIKARIHLTQAEQDWLEREREVRVRIGQWPPFMFTVDEPSGISVDYLDVVSRACGLKFIYLTEKDISWPQAMKSIETRDGVDMVPAIQPTSERERFMAFSEAYQTLPWVIVARDDAVFIGGVEDLRNMTVSIQRGFVLQTILERDYPDIPLRIVKTATPTLDSLLEVSTGQAQATINALPVVAYFIRKYGLTNLKIAAPAGFDEMKLAMGVRKDWPELASILTKTFQAMSRKDVAAINNAWLSVRYDYGLSPRTVLFWAMITGGVVLALIVALHLINMTLKRQVAERTKEMRLELQERVLTEAALHESELQFRSLVEDCPMPMVLEDTQGKIWYLNKQFKSMFGYAIEDFPDLKTGFKQFFPDPVYRAECAMRWAEASKKAQEEGGPILGGEVFFTCKDGAVKLLDITGMPVGTKIITVFVDLTERKRAEELMIQAEKMMSLGGLAAGMAHEINNPLGIILASAQNAARRMSPEFQKNRLAAEALGLDMDALAVYADKREINHYLDSIREAGSRAGAIVRNMLDFSRQSESRRAFLSVNTLLDKVLELASNDYDLKKNYDFRAIEIVRDYDPDMRPAPLTETEIEQVFLNILKNAAQAMADNKEAGKRSRIVLRTSRENGWIRVEIEDNGPGLTEQERRRAFEPFFTTKPPGKGTGLGLSVSYFIVTRNHGGEISIESKPGEGSICIIRLPAFSPAA